MARGSENVSGFLRSCHVRVPSAHRRRRGLSFAPTARAAEFCHESDRCWRPHYKGSVGTLLLQIKAMPRRQQEDLHRRDPCSFTDSPLGPLLTSDAQSLMVALISLLGLLFPDHDCTRVTPHDFQLCSDKHAVVNSINHNLSAVVDRTRTGFMMELWIAVQDAIDLGNCEIYALQPRPGTFEPAENSLMSLHYFFVDQNHGRVLFIGGVTKSRGSAGCGNILGQRGRPLRGCSFEQLEKHGIKSARGGVLLRRRG